MGARNPCELWTAVAYSRRLAGCQQVAIPGGGVINEGTISRCGSRVRAWGMPTTCPTARSCHAGPVIHAATDRSNGEQERSQSACGIGHFTPGSAGCFAPGVLRPSAMDRFIRPVSRATISGWSPATSRVSPRSSARL